MEDIENFIAKQKLRLLEDKFRLGLQVDDSVSAVVDKEDVQTSFQTQNLNDLDLNHKEKPTNVFKRNEKVYVNPFKLFDEVNKENIENVTEKINKSNDIKFQKVVKVRHSDGGSVHDLVVKNKNFGKSVSSVSLFDNLDNLPLNELTTCMFMRKLSLIYY